MLDERTPRLVLRMYVNTSKYVILLRTPPPTKSSLSLTVYHQYIRSHSHTHSHTNTHTQTWALWNFIHRIQNGAVLVPASCHLVLSGYEEAWMFSCFNAKLDLQVSFVFYFMYWNIWFSFYLLICNIKQTNTHWEAHTPTHTHTHSHAHMHLKKVK